MQFTSRRGRSAALLAALSVALSPALATPGFGADGGRPADPPVRTQAGPAAGADAVPGEVLVRFREPAVGGSGRAAQALAEVGRVAASLDRVVPGLQRVALDDGVTVAEAVAELEARDDVLYAEPNHLMRAAGIPSETRFRELWGLHNTGQTVQGVAGTKDADIDAPEAWNVTTGSASVTVAVLDTGVAQDHPDLAPNMWVNSDEVAGNGVDDDRNGFVDDRTGWDFVAEDNSPSDEQGHGTHVAGTIGARGGNDTTGAGATDVAGVAWNVRLMPLRVLDAKGNGNYGDLIEAVDYAHRNGARIGNMSLSGWESSQALYDAMRAASGVTWMTAAGNDGRSVDDWWLIYPCMFDLANVVCVAATDSRDRLAPFSNYGRTSVDVAAPGKSTLSTAAYHRVFRDDFERDTGRWVMGGSPNTWARTTNVPWGATGTWLTDSPAGNYPNSSENWARTTAFDLTGKRDCAVKYYALTDTESWFDFYYVEVAKSPSGPWTQIERNGGFLDAPYDVRMPDAFDGANGVYVRFRFAPDDQYDGDGLYFDDFAIDCVGTYGGGSFQYLSGTSMATPHVSGVAALVLARNPGFTTAQLRSKLLASVDVKTSLSGKVVTGGRINANKAVR